ncbi:MAG: sigma-70 family RNA polymerase sigma factor [Firmicutes bacterium]|uniref:sigma-70 family RNA polymerase sigma factor n=1 Tax=Melghirimyces thermohalophilus TaxID=1236220 RepID=UPI000B862BF8|nr:sigma-70 family RNA polymerase sigma factor [Melghirimyces thermohalophilus]MDA8352891.1 sigma-70 family RNA polymerase sigma factor [Bacillota bacterium]
MHGPGDGDRNLQEMDVEQRVWIAQQEPSSRIRDELIAENQLYVKKIASKICKRNITAQDDEFSVALMGFNEAINNYRRDQSSTFPSFAYTVMKRRLTDYFRSEKRHLNQMPLVHPDAKDNESTYPEVVKKSFEQYEDRELEEHRRSDVAEFREHLSRFGITMEKLVNVSPKHRDTRENLLKIAQKIVSEKDLFDSFYKQQRIKREVAERLGCHRRTLKRHRHYLIALVVVLVEDLPTIRGYLGVSSEPKGGGDS